MQKLKVNVNGEDREVEVDPTKPLLWVLREDLKLTGTKFGCGASQCGACTVHMDGQAIRSCVTPIEAAAGKKVTTIEGLDPNQEHPLQVAWREMAVPQCGYCQSGQIMSAAALLAKNPKPDAKAVESAMQGNLCRCGTYGRIKAAILKAADSAK